MHATQVDNPLRTEEAQRLFVKLLGHRVGDSTIPAYLHIGIVMYILVGQRPGRLLSAVLEDKLSDAVNAADPDSLRGLTALVSFLHFDTPDACHGSISAVAMWVAAGGRFGGAR